MCWLIRVNQVNQVNLVNQVNKISNPHVDLCFTTSAITWRHWLAVCSMLAVFADLFTFIFSNLQLPLTNITSSWAFLSQIAHFVAWIFHFFQEKIDYYWKDIYFIYQVCLDCNSFGRRPTGSAPTCGILDQSDLKCDIYSRKGYCKLWALSWAGRTLFLCDSSSTYLIGTNVNQPGLATCHQPELATCPRPSSCSL